MRIIGGRIITLESVLTNMAIQIEGRTIHAIEPGARAASSDDTIIDAGDWWVAPGLIDIHVHGGDGFDTMDATPESLHGMARFFARHGVTGYYPTTITAPPDAIQAAIDNVTETPQPDDGAHHLGVHIEGPYLSPTHPGAQPIEALRLPDPDEYTRWLKNGMVRLITLAPEIEGALALIRLGAARGVEFAAGHTDATFSAMEAAVEAGLHQTTHTYNAMRGLHHREPGALGAALVDDRIYGQIIADGVHVHPAMVKLLWRAKSTTHTLLITDSMRAAGLADGEYDLGGQMVRVREGIARTVGGALSGSTATLYLVLRNMIDFTCVSVPESVQMATSVPAAAMNLLGRKGMIAPEADADLILLDDALRVRLTIVAGQVVYDAR